MKVYFFKDLFHGQLVIFCVGGLLGRQDGAENCQTPSGQGLHHGSLLAVLLLDGFGKPLITLKTALLLETRIPTWVSPGSAAPGWFR